MTAFRILLVAIIMIVGAYTAVVISNHGADFLTPFYGDIAKMGWAGQFNIDFNAFLILGSLWLMWRHHFAPLGLFFGLVIFAGGAPFLCTYMLVVMAKDKAGIAELLLGKRRVAALQNG